MNLGFSETSDFTKKIVDLLNDDELVHYRISCAETRILAN